MNRDAAHVARLIGKTPNWVKRNAARYPHSRAGRTYFWTDADVAALLEVLRVRPQATAPATDELRPITGRRRSA